MKFRTTTLASLIVFVYMAGMAVAQQNQSVAPFVEWGPEPVSAGADEQYAPGLVSLGDGFAACWESCAASCEVRCVALSSDGMPAGAPEVVSRGDSWSVAPSACAAGDKLGVAWQDYRDKDWEIYFSTIENGVVGPEVRVTSEKGYSQGPAIAWSGSEFGVVWKDNRDHMQEIYFALLSASGARIGPDVRVSYSNQKSEAPSIAWTGSGFGVAWQDRRNGTPAIYYSFISAGGTPGPEIEATGPDAYADNPSLARAGDELGLAWEDHRGGSWDVYFARLSASGAMVGGEQIIATGDRSQIMPSLAWAGGSFVVAYADKISGSEYRIMASRFSADGQAIEDPVAIDNAGAIGMFPSVVAGAGSATLIWEDYRDGDAQAYMAKIAGARDATTDSGFIALPLTASSGGDEEDSGMSCSMSASGTPGNTAISLLLLIAPLGVAAILRQKAVASHWRE